MSTEVCVFCSKSITWPPGWTDAEIAMMAPTVRMPSHVVFGKPKTCSACKVPKYCSAACKSAHSIPHSLLCFDAEKNREMARVAAEVAPRGYGAELSPAEEKLDVALLARELVR